MTDDRKGGAALIAGAVLGLLTMSLHPSGRDLLATGQFSPTAFLAGLAHAIAIASMRALLSMDFAAVGSLPGSMIAATTVSIILRALTAFSPCLASGR